MSYFIAGLSGASQGSGATKIAHTVSDSDSSSDESSEAQEPGDDATDLVIDVDVDNVDVGDDHTDIAGTSSAAKISSSVPRNSSEEYSLESYDRAAQKKTKKAKKKSFVADEKSHHAYSMTTFKNKLGVAGMEAFLSRREFGIDVATEFPLKPTMGTPFYDSDNNSISRAEALAYKCHELHQLLIDAYKAAVAEEVSRDAAAKQIFDGHRHDLPNAMVPDTHLTMLARIDLQTIRDRALIQIDTAYNNNEQPSAELTELELGTDNIPILSVAVQQLIYKVVDAQIRGNRLRALHVSESGNHRFQIPVEHEKLRRKLRDELRSTLILEEDVDQVAIVTKLVVQEFPPQL